MNKKVAELNQRYPELEICTEDIELAIDKIIKCFENGGKVLLCGNGGSAADCTHIVGEFMKGFLKKRPVDDNKKAALKSKNALVTDEFLSKLQCGLPCVNLCESSALLSAFCNDVDPDFIYAQQVFGLGKPGDVLIGITTSGNAVNVNNAAIIAMAMGITVIGLTGETGGKLSHNSSLCIKAPSAETFKVQEFHLPIYHAICSAVEEHFFNV